MYTVTNYRTKKAVKEAIARGDVVTVYQPGPFGGNKLSDGVVALEGPHFPEPHRWYAQGTLQGGQLVKVR